MLSQIPSADATEADMTRLRDLLRELKADNSNGLTFQKLDLATTELRVNTDAIFANNKDLSSQLGR